MLAVDGDVHRGRLDQEGKRSNRGALRDLLLQKPRLRLAGRSTGARSVEGPKSWRQKADPYLFVDARYGEGKIDGGW